MSFFLFITFYFLLWTNCKHIEVEHILLPVMTNLVSFIFWLHLPPAHYLEASITHYIVSPTNISLGCSKRKRSLFIFNFFMHAQEYIFIDFRERGSGGGERNIDMRNIGWLPPIRVLTRDQTCNMGVCPDGESDLWPLSAQDNTPTNQATPPRASLLLYFYFIKAVLSRYNWHTALY